MSWSQLLSVSGSSWTLFLGRILVWSCLSFTPFLSFLLLFSLSVFKCLVFAVLGIKSRGLHTPGKPAVTELALVHDLLKNAINVISLNVVWLWQDDLSVREL